ncbi:MAG: pyridoxal phosphate-dependent aminotransferase [Lachnospiraceae bacterium]|nr:pyridoxal phosphate-dependent aminotransferase [Lachnospiraceae bacterium]
MKYDFDTIIDRRSSDSVKWDVSANELPMWVADMDFQAAPQIREALEKRLAHGVFGYADVSVRWRAAYANWWRDRHGFAMKGECLVYCTGVIPVLSSAVRKFATPNENVLVQTPVYPTFFNSIVNNGCRVLENPLIYENGAYRMDFADLERKMSDPQTSLMILCNPHNPIGKIWSREELAKVGELAKKHHVIVLSDEIHCDITAPGTGYVPFASVSDACREVSISCIAPTKAFNLAGLHTAAAYAEDPVLRHKIWRAVNTDEVGEPNSFAETAAIAAFTEGGEWLDEMRAYVFENRRYVAETLAAELPEVFVVPGEATYLLWIDLTAMGGSSEEIAHFLREKTGLFVSDGRHFADAGAEHIRMNVACPRALCEDGVRRLIDGLRLWQKR